MAAPAPMYQALLRLVLHSSSHVTTAIPAVSGSTIAVRPSWYDTPAISASAVAFTPSRRADVHSEDRSLSTSRVSRPTNTKEGRKIASVARNAPSGPATRYPMNVAVVNTGPGVT